MKKILIMILAVVAAMGLNAQSAFFKGCEDMPGVSTVYISRRCLELAGASNITGGDFDIGGHSVKARRAGDSQRGRQPRQTERQVRRFQFGERAMRS